MSEVLVVLQEPLLVLVEMIALAQVDERLLLLHVGLQTYLRLVMAANHVRAGGGALVLRVIHFHAGYNKSIIKKFIINSKI